MENSRTVPRTVNVPITRFFLSRFNVQNRARKKRLQLHNANKDVNYVDNIFDCHGANLVKRARRAGGHETKEERERDQEGRSKEKERERKREIQRYIDGQ